MLMRSEEPVSALKMLQIWLPDQAGAQLTMTLKEI